MKLFVRPLSLIVVLAAVALPLLSGATKVLYRVDATDVLLGSFMIAFSFVALAAPAAVSYFLGGVFYLVSMNVNLHSLQSGHLSCGCFRGITLSPLIAMSISLTMVSSYFMFPHLIVSRLTALRASRVALWSLVFSAAVISGAAIYQCFAQRDIIPRTLASILDANSSILGSVVGSYEVQARIEQQVTPTKPGEPADKGLNFELRFKYLYMTLSNDKNYRERRSDGNLVTEIILTNANKLLIHNPLQNRVKLIRLTDYAIGDFFNIRTIGLNTYACNLREYLATFSSVRVMHGSGSDIIIATDPSGERHLSVMNGVIRSVLIYDSTRAAVGKITYEYGESTPIPTKVSIEWNNRTDADRIHSRFTYAITKLTEIADETRFSASGIITNKCEVHDAVDSGGMVYDLSRLAADDTRQRIVRQFDGSRSFTVFDILQYSTFNLFVFGSLWLLARLPAAMRSFFHRPWSPVPSP
jgi:hypothetical protein